VRPQFFSATSARFALVPSCRSRKAKAPETQASAKRVNSAVTLFTSQVPAISAMAMAKAARRLAVRSSFMAWASFSARTQACASKMAGFQHGQGPAAKYSASAPGCGSPNGQGKALLPNTDPAVVRCRCIRLPPAFPYPRRAAGSNGSGGMRKVMAAPFAKPAERIKLNLAGLTQPHS
jgi:hypothetical protein